MCVCCPDAVGPSAPALLCACRGNPASAGWFRPRSRVFTVTGCSRASGPQISGASFAWQAMAVPGPRCRPGRPGCAADCCGGPHSVCAHLCASACASLCVCGCTRVSVCMCTHACICELHACTHMHTCISLRADVCVNVHLRVCIPPQPAAHVHTGWEAPQDAGGERREDQGSGSGPLGPCRH